MHINELAFICAVLAYALIYVWHTIVCIGLYFQTCALMYLWLIARYSMHYVRIW